MAMPSWLGRLLGRSTYALPAPAGALELTSPEVERTRRAFGGQINPLPVTQTRWYLEDVETAEVKADFGDLSMAARLMRAARKDAAFSGVLSTRTLGLVRLPKRFRGDA